jgi:hypothetical protein
MNVLDKNLCDAERKTQALLLFLKNIKTEHESLQKHFCQAKLKANAACKRLKNKKVEDVTTLSNAMSYELCVFWFSLRI